MGMKDLSKLPDPTKHQYISFAKSGVRIVAGIAFCMGLLVVGGALIIAAEVLGIVEELV